MASLFKRASMSICHYLDMLESIYHRASRFVGLPNYIPHGLRHVPASMYLPVSPGLPLRRASLTRTIKASGIDRLPFLSRSF